MWLILGGMMVTAMAVMRQNRSTPSPGVYDGREGWRRARMALAACRRETA